MAYKNIEDKRKYAREWIRKKRIVNLEYRTLENKKQKEAYKKRYQEDPVYRAQRIERSSKYNKEHRDKVNEGRKRRHEDSAYREYWNKKNNERNRQRYAMESDFRERIKKNDQKRYVRLSVRSPWLFHWKNAHQRCSNSNRKDYKYYGERGIHMLLTVDEAELLYKRDNADQMKRPSIDRIDNNGNYCFENCRFIEQSENTKRRI